MPQHAPVPAPPRAHRGTYWRITPALVGHDPLTPPDHLTPRRSAAVVTTSTLTTNAASTMPAAWGRRRQSLVNPYQNQGMGSVAPIMRATTAHATGPEGATKRKGETAPTVQ